MLELNTVLNQIHDWGNKDNPFLKQHVLTRFGGLGCAALEAVNIIVKPLMLGLNALESLGKLPIKAARIVFPHSEKLREYDAKLPGPKDLWESAKKIFKLIIGFFSTLFFGVLISPEKNFENHVALGLANAPTVAERLAGWKFRLGLGTW